MVIIQHCSNMIPLAIHPNRCSHKSSRARSKLVNILGKSLVTSIHLAKARQNRGGAVVIISRNICLPLFHKCLCFTARRIQVTALSEFAQNSRTLTVQHFPLCLIIATCFFLIFSISNILSPALLCFGCVFLSYFFQFGRIKRFSRISGLIVAFSVSLFVSLTHFPTLSSPEH